MPAPISRRVSSPITAGTRPRREASSERQDASGSQRIPICRSWRRSDRRAQPRGEDQGALMLSISVLLSEEEILAGLVEDLRARRLPEKYFYWSPQSASAWLALCRSTAYLNYRRSLGLLVERSASLLESFRRRPADDVSLGAGDGSKEDPILEALAARGARRPYVAVDLSQWLLEAAPARAAAAGDRVRG